MGNALKLLRGLKIHLSTAIVVMFVAAVFLWANCRKRFYESDTGYFTQGWPVPFYYPGGIQENLSYSIGPFEPAILFMDVVIGLLILSAVALVCEARIRRKSIAWTLFSLLLFVLASCAFLIFLMVVLHPWVGHRHRK